MFYKLIQRIAMLILIRRGFTPWGALSYLDDLKIDFKETRINLKEKLWAYKRGFLSRRIFDYDIKKNKIENYVNDYEYYKAYPFNNRYRKWIDDKLTFRMILDRFQEYLPKYYFEIYKGAVIKLTDCPKSYKSSFSSVIDLLKEKKQLAAKLPDNSGGIGFFKFYIKEDCFFANNKSMNLKEFEEFLRSFDNLLLTEYIFSHSVLQKIYAPAPNTLRVVTLRDNLGDVNILGTVFRFGTSKSGFVDNMFAGGILCGVDKKNGLLYNPKMKINGRLADIQNHPDTNEEINWKIPCWDLIISKINEISDWMPQLRYMGFDIIITEHSFKIIEINTLPGIYIIQGYHPLGKNKLFKELVLNNNSVT